MRHRSSAVSTKSFGLLSFAVVAALMAIASPALAAQVTAAPTGNGMTLPGQSHGVNVTAAPTPQAPTQAQSGVETQPEAPQAPVEQTTHSGTIAGTILKMDFPDSGSGNIAGFEIHPSSPSINIPALGPVMDTHLRILVPASGPMTPVAHNTVMRNLMTVSPFTNPTFVPMQNTPASIACVYGLAPQPAGQPAGCNPAYTSVNPAGGNGAIALVDAYHYASAANDVGYFSRFFGLPLADIHVIYAGGPAPYITGTKPAVDSGWNLEAALDIEWAHAMAPSAKIYLVEAQDNHLSSLMTAIAAAQYLVANSGGGEVSMSFGGTEVPGITAYDSVLSSAGSNVVQVTSSGDTGSVVQYPASSPYVVSVGGTALNRVAGGAFYSETAWSESGGGISAYESRPSFQDPSPVQTLVGTHRGIPDVSMVADPSTGAAVYMGGAWYTVGGTSLAAPVVAGLLNASASHAGSFPSQSTAIATLYTNGGGTTLSRDITDGACGSNSALTGYDFCTGNGSLISYPYDTANHPATQSCSLAFGGNNIMDLSLNKGCSKSLYTQ